MPDELPAADQASSTTALRIRELPPTERPRERLTRLGGSALSAVELLALVIGMGGVYQHEQQERLADLADIDAAVLADELPLTAYLDTGFPAYLESQQRQQ